MTPNQQEAMERVRRDLADADRWGANAAGVAVDDVRTLLALLDEQREALRPFGEAHCHRTGPHEDYDLEDISESEAAYRITFGHLRRAAELTGEG